MNITALITEFAPPLAAWLDMDARDITSPDAFLQAVEDAHRIASTGSFTEELEDDLAAALTYLRDADGDSGNGQLLARARRHLADARIGME